jgi:hypothetical protein
MDHLFSNVWQSQDICFGPAEESWISRKDQEIAWEPGSAWKFPHHASTSSTLFGYWDQHVVLFTVSLSILTINNPEDTLNTSWSC